MKKVIVESLLHAMFVGLIVGAGNAILNNGDLISSAIGIAIGTFIYDLILEPFRKGLTPVRD